MILEESDLSLIESNHPSALVQRLIWTIRLLQDDRDAACAEVDVLREALDEYEA